jgi:hypothetical protein
MPPDVSQPDASMGRVAAQTTSGNSSPARMTVLFVAPRVVAFFEAIGCSSCNFKRVGGGGPPSATRSTAYFLASPGLNVKLMLT